MASRLTNSGASPTVTNSATNVALTASSTSVTYSFTGAKAGYYNITGVALTADTDSYVNYSLTTTSSNFTIAKRNVSLTWAGGNSSVTYKSGTYSDVKATVAGLQGSDKAVFSVTNTYVTNTLNNASGVSNGTYTFSAINAGTYNVTAVSISSVSGHAFWKENGPFLQNTAQLFLNR